jgi:hypothetical protein
MGTFKDGSYPYDHSLYSDWDRRTGDNPTNETRDYRVFLRGGVEASYLAFGIKSYDNINSSTESGRDEFYVKCNGELYATKADIKGKITATTGDIGGWTISDKAGYAGGIYNDVDNYRVGIKTVGCGPTDYSFYVVKNPLDSANREVFFGVQHNGKLFAKNADIEGKVKANDGLIGGWTIADDQLYAYGNSDDDNDAGILNGISKVKLGPDGVAAMIAVTDSKDGKLKYYKAQLSWYNIVVGALCGMVAWAKIGGSVHHKESTESVWNDFGPLDDK